MAIYKHTFHQAISWLNGPGGVAAQYISSATNYKGMYFVAPWSKTINEVRVYVEGNVGTPTSAMKIGIYEVTSRYSATPAITLLESVTVTPVAGAQDVTGFTTALTANKAYAVLANNVHATPGSNYFKLFASTYGYWSPFLPGPNATSGTALASIASPQLAMRIKFSDTTYYGMALNAASAANTSETIYSAREVGQMWQCPFDCNVAGLGLTHFVTNVGTPTGNLRLRLYTGNSTRTLVGTTADLWVLTSGSVMQGFFSSPVSISKGDYINVMLGETTQSDTSSNRFQVNMIPWENTSESLGLLPNGNRMVHTTDGTTFTEYPAWQIPGMGLILENNDEHPAGASGGGIILPRSVNGV